MSKQNIIRRCNRYTHFISFFSWSYVNLNFHMCLSSASQEKKQQNIVLASYEFYLWFTHCNYSQLIKVHIYILLWRYCHDFSYPAIMSSSPPEEVSSRVFNHKTRERTRRAGTGTSLFKWMSHLSTTGLIKPTKLLSFFLKSKCIY